MSYSSKTEEGKGSKKVKMGNLEITADAGRHHFGIVRTAVKSDLRS